VRCLSARSLRAVWNELEPLGFALYIEAILEVKAGTAEYRPQAGKKGKLYRDPKLSDMFTLWRKHSIGGGEPFTRRDLPQLVQVFYERSRTHIVTVATNGAFPDRVQQYLQYLAEHCPGIQMRVQVSIDNLYEKHDQNRGLAGLFEKLLDACRVIEAAKEAGAPVMLSIGTVLTPWNRNDLDDLRTFLDANVAFDDLSLIYPRGNAHDPRFKRVTLAEYRQAKKTFEATRAHPGSFARLYQAIAREATRGIEDYLERGPDGYPWTCVAGRKLITLTEKGLLRPCEMLCQIKPDIDSDLGNVREHDYDIPRMLASDKGKRLRKYVKETHCSCSYECAAMCNVVFHKKRWPALVKEVLID
jgi:MoaA/NifB/PqqE/SkfB family radical SAM enzyme